MKSITFKKAFSLTELLIVMVIIGILFAALLPIMTKRRSGDTIANEPVWSFVANNDQRDAFYDPGTTGQTSTAYVGISPDNIASNVKPYSKMVIKTRPNQHMIQFRYGSGNGLFTGVFSMDGSKNIMMGGKIDTRSNPDENYFIGGRNNTVAGMGAFSRTLTPESVLALGSNAVMGKQGGSSPSEIVAVGANSGQYMSYAGRNTFMGANSGRAESATITDTVGIGSGVLGISTSSGKDNVFAGYFAGFAGFDNHDKSINNTILGSTYYGTTAANNTIAGYDSFVGGKYTAQNLSVAGYEACLSMQYNASNSKDPGRRTCLGYGSAKNRGHSVGGSPASFEQDKYDHIFLGGSPEGFGGRSVLEVHNIIGKPAFTVKPSLGPTVVLNSNLVVRGNVFMPSVQNGELWGASGNPALTESLIRGSEAGGDRCGRRCLFGRKKFRDAPKCKLLGSILGAIIGVVAAVISIVTFGAATPLAAAIYITLWSGTAGGTIGSLFNGSDYERPKDPPSFTWLTYDDREDITTCGSDQYPNGSTCPKLNISDARLKNIGSENIAALEKIMMLVPYNYTFKADKDALAQVGVMAQDLQKIFPDSVSEDKDGYLNIRWDEMFFAVINSVKELNANVNAVTADLQVVEQDTDSVADAQHNIKDRISKLNEKLESLENNK